MRITLVAIALSCGSLWVQSARAQLEPLEEGISVGAWTFYPSLGLRLRGEYHRNPIDVGGDVYSASAIQLDAFESAAPPIVRRDSAVEDQWLFAERARVGLSVEWQVLAASVVLQDARVLGVVPGAAAEAADGSFGTFGVYQAFLDVRTDVEDPLFRARVGRQAVRWGDGRLIGEADWAPRGASLDAARGIFAIGPVDLELLAALLAPPGSIPPPYERPDDTPERGTGSQLYGLDVTWRIVPLFGAEATAIARVARDPLPPELARSDTFTVGGRVFGDFRGLVYAAEGHYQLGRVAGYEGTAAPIRDISAFAVAGHVGWQTALPGKLRFGARGAYASGDDSGGRGETFERFDPIAPTVHEHHGLMDLYAWSNLIEAGGSVGTRPLDELGIDAAYAFVGLAEPNDRWTNAYLVPVGAAPANESMVLGHEIDLLITVEPWSFASFSAGYGLMVLGDGGRAILATAGRGDDAFLHYGVAQAEIHAP